MTPSAYSGGMVRALNTGFSSTFNKAPGDSCTGYSTYGPDVIYEISVPAGSTLDVTMDPQTSADQGIYLLDDCIVDYSGSNCLAADDDGANGVAESISWTNTGGDAIVYLVVDGFNMDQTGPYTLDIDVTP